jgi:quercetin dioxygenase-like cupin family protein
LSSSIARQYSSAVERALKLSPRESIAIRSSTPELLEVEATYGPHGKPPPRHLHPSQEERFEVLAGVLRARVGEEERTLGRGEELEIPPGVPHQMWNPAEEPARVLWQTRPGGRTEQWFRAIDALHREGSVGPNGRPGPLAFAPLLREYGDVFRLATGPEPLVRAGVAALALVGRLRGHSRR